jgi:tetratricopeptide (TPR) repeat protein
MKLRALLSVLLFLPGCAFAQSAPLDRAEILGRLAQDYSPSYVAHLVKIRGVSFSSSEDFLYRVKLAGGDGILAERLLSAEASKQPRSFSDPDASYDHLAKCAELNHTGAIEPAKKECAAAIDENPRSPWPLLATAQLLQNDPFNEISSESSEEINEKRTDLLRRAAALAPNLASVHRALASTVPADQAMAELQKSSALGPDALESNGFAFSGQGAIGVSSSTFYFGTSGDGSEPPASSDESIALDSEVRRRAETEPELASSHLALAIAYAQVRNFDRAESELRTAIGLEPDNPWLHESLASLYLLRHNAEACLAEFREGVRIAPYGIQPRMILASGLKTLGRTPEAIAELQHLLAIHPRATEPSEGLIELYLENEDRKSAIAELRRSLKASSVTFNDQAKFVDARFQDLERLAHLLKENREFDAAAEQYRNLLRYKPDWATLHNDYGNVLLDQHRLEEGMGEYNEALRLNPEDPAAHHNLGLCLTLKKNLDGAIAEFRKSLELDPDDPGTQIFLGAALGQKGDLNAAIEHFRAVIEKDPKNPEAHVNLAYALYLLKDIPGSIHELKLTLELKPDSAFALNHLAWIYATAADRKLRNPAEAVVLARRAVQSSREPNAAFIDTLAEALLVNGQAAEALATEQRAAELDPQNAEVQSRLARFREAAHKVVSTKP